MENADAMKAFFALWSEADDAARLSALSALVSEGVFYADPSAPGPLAGVADLAAFLGAFSSNMPGAMAQVVEPVDVIHGHARATVRFERDGTAFATGQYFGEIDEDGRLCRVIGFMGKGPE